MRNLIEPEGLLAHFLSHPPDGFEPARTQLGTPIFRTRFDLLTTADSALRGRLTALPLYRHWRSWLRPRTCFAGTTVSEYAPLPQDPPPQRLLADLLEDHAPGQPFLIVKDLPAQSPLLSDADNAFSDELVQAAIDAGCVPLAGQALAYVRLDFDSIDQYLGQLPAARRKDLRRKLRSRRDVDIELLPTGAAAFDDAALLADLYELYLAVFRQSSIHFDRLTPEFFAAVLRDPTLCGLVFLYRRNGRLIGFNLCLVWDDKLIDKYVGFRYPDSRQCNLYFVSWFENLQLALARGLSYYVAGWTDPEIKRYLGARFTWTRHVAYARNPALRAALRLLRSRFESDRQWHEGLR